MSSNKQYKRRVNNKGRNTGQQFIRLGAEVTRSPAWRSLCCEARSLLIEIWRRHNGTNNGVISYSHREAKESLCIGSTRVKRAFDQLKDRGFLIIRRASSFNFKFNGGASRATEWELTTERCDDKSPKHNYRSYRN
jgi:hypothetical protein